MPTRNEKAPDAGQGVEGISSRKEPVDMSHTVAPAAGNHLSPEWFGTPGHFCDQPSVVDGTDCLGRAGHTDDHRSHTSRWHNSPTIPEIAFFAQRLEVDPWDFLKAVVSLVSDARSAEGMTR